MSMITCKIVFRVKSKLEDVKKIFSRYTSEYIIHNFYEDMEVGCNNISFAMVDLPEEVIENISRDKIVKSVELLNQDRRKTFPKS